MQLTVTSSVIVDKLVRCNVCKILTHTLTKHNFKMKGEFYIRCMSFSLLLKMKYVLLPDKQLSLRSLV